MSFSNCKVAVAPYESPFSFDSTLEDYPVLKACFHIKCSIVYSSYFKLALIRFQDWQCDFSLDEKCAVHCLQLCHENNFENDQSRGSIVERSQKSLWEDGENKRSAHFQTQFLVPTINLCKQFPSILRYAIIIWRRGVLAANVKSKLF